MQKITLDSVPANTNMANEVKLMHIIEGVE